MRRQFSSSAPSKTNQTHFSPSSPRTPRRIRMVFLASLATLARNGVYTASMRIEGKTALVTGGSSGLGAASARMIVENGGRVVIADLKPGADFGEAAVL